MDIQASLGIHQLKRVGKYLKIREKIWKKYDRAFQGLPLTVPAPAEKDTVHARHLYTPLLDIDATDISRDAFQQGLHIENIGTGIHFVALHLHPYYANTFGLKRGDFPNAEFISDRTISLPLSAKLTEEDTDDVICAVKRCLKNDQASSVIDCWESGCLLQWVQRTQRGTGVETGHRPPPAEYVLS